MTIRPLETQFDAETLRRLRGLQDRVSAIQEVNAVPRYLTVELSRSIEAGLLLAALHLCCSIWEFALRRAVVSARAGNELSEKGLTRPHDRSRLLSLAEDDRRLTFGAMLKELVSSGVVTSDEAATMESAYRDIRIPLHHGILGRYVRHRSDTGLLDMLELLGVDAGLDSRSFEDRLEAHSLNEMEVVLAQIDVLCRRPAV